MRSLSRSIALTLLVVIPVPGSAEVKEPVKQKPAYVGVMIAAGEKKDTVVVLMVIADGPAEKAGLEGGDRIISIDGAKPTTVKAAVEVIRALKPGKKVKLVVERGGKEKTLDLVPASVED